ncbi:MAG: hypothetical protein IJ184_01150 [Alphaproteobacteria bacterium]|nr:hypothetical protein [Alphaproteobacteria bacterium]
MAVEDAQYQSFLGRLYDARIQIAWWYKQKGEAMYRRGPRPFGWEEANRYRDNLSSYFRSLGKDEAARVAGNFAFAIVKTMYKYNYFRKDVETIVTLCCKDFMTEEDKSKLGKLMAAIKSPKSKSNSKTEASEGKNTSEAKNTAAATSKQNNKPQEPQKIAAPKLAPKKPLVYKQAAISFTY